MRAILNLLPLHFLFFTSLTVYLTSTLIDDIFVTHYLPLQRNIFANYCWLYQNTYMKQIISIKNYHNYNYFKHQQTQKINDKMMLVKEVLKFVVTVLTRLLISIKQMSVSHWWLVCLCHFVE